MIGLVLAVVGILIIAGATFALLGDNNKYTPKVGDFLKYEISYIPSQPLRNITFEVLGVNSTSVYYKMTSNDQISFQNVSRNVTHAAQNVNPYSANYSETYLGKANIDTKWGMKSTDHYYMSDSLMHMETWARNGFTMKLVVVNVFDNTTITQILVDTNISQVTD